MRFCARWRRECPTVAYADQFLMLDADGPGRLIGFVYLLHHGRGRNPETGGARRIAVSLRRQLYPCGGRKTWHVHFG